jgi:hypothetical protein
MKVIIKAGNAPIDEYVESEGEDGESEDEPTADEQAVSVAQEKANLDAAGRVISRWRRGNWRPWCAQNARGCD